MDAAPRRVVAALAPLLVLAALVTAAACGRVGGGREAAAPTTATASATSAARPTTTTVAASPTVAPSPTGEAPPATAVGDPVDLGTASRYVALGDSFSAGAGLAPYDDARCGRSPRAYPNLVRFTGPARVEVIACEAARVAGVAAQADATTWGDDVGLVTVTVGGNDVGFVDFFAACGLRPACFEQPYGGYDTLDAWSAARRQALGPELTALLADLRRRAPEAQVVLLGYPQLLPEVLGPGPGCDVLGLAFDAGERRALRQGTDALNATLAAAASAAGATFAPVADRFAGHEACSDDPWLLFGGLADLVSAPEGVLHPNDTGQAAYAAALLDALPR